MNPIAIIWMHQPLGSGTIGWIYNHPFHPYPPVNLFLLSRGWGPPPHPHPLTHPHRSLPAIHLSLSHILFISIYPSLRGAAARRPRDLTAGREQQLWAGEPWRAGRDATGRLNGAGTRVSGGAAPWGRSCALERGPRGWSSVPECGRSGAPKRLRRRGSWRGDKACHAGAGVAESRRHEGGARKGDYGEGLIWIFFLSFVSISEVFKNFSKVSY